MAENTTITHEHTLRIVGEADFSGVDKQFQNMIKDLDSVVKASAKVSAGWKNLKSAAGNFTSIAKSIAAVAGASIGMQKSLDVFAGYNKELIKLSVQFAKYGNQIGQVEKSLSSLSKELNITRMDTIKLFSLYEKGFPYVTLVGAEKLFKNIRKAVGANSAAMQEMAQNLSSIANAYPGLQESIENVDEADKELLKTKLQLLVVTNKISLAQYKGAADYLALNGQNNKQAKEYQEALADMERLWQDVAIVIGQQIIPWVKDLSGYLKENEKSIKSIASFLGKIAPVLALFAGVTTAAKAISSLKGGLSSIFSGIMGGKRGSDIGTPMYVYVTNKTPAGQAAGAAGAAGGMSPFSWGGGKAGAARGLGVGLGLGAAGFGLGAASESKWAKRNEGVSGSLGAAGDVAKYAAMGSVIGPAGTVGGAAVGAVKSVGTAGYGLYKAREELAKARNREGFQDAQISESKKMYGPAQGAGGQAKDIANLDKLIAQQEEYRKKFEKAGKIGAATFAAFDRRDKYLAKLKGIRDPNDATPREKALAEGRKKVSDDTKEANALAIIKEQEVLTSSMVAKRTALGGLVDSTSQSILRTGLSEGKQALFTENVKKELLGIDQERSSLATLITKKQAFLNKMTDEERKNSPEALAAETQIAELRGQMMQLDVKKADTQLKQLNTMKGIAEYTAAEAGSRSSALSALITQQQITGDIDSGKEQAAYEETINRFKRSQLDATNERVQAETDLADIIEKEPKNKNKIAQKEDLVNQALAKELSVTQKIQAANEAHISQYATKQQLAQVSTEMASIEVTLMDSLVNGLGASVDARYAVAAAQEEQIALKREEIKQIDSMNKEQREQDQNVLKRKQAEKDIQNLMLGQANTLKSIRDGWVSSIQAMTIGSGRITKLTISSNENLRQGLSAMDMLRSASSGAVQRAGEKNIGFMTPERLRAEAGGTVSIDNKRTSEVAYGLDTGDLGSTPEEALANIRKRNAAARSKGGAALGFTGSGPTGSAVISPTMGTGTGGSQILPADVQARARASGSGSFSTGRSAPTANKANIMNLNWSFSFTNIKDAVDTIGKRLSDAFNQHAKSAKD